MIREENDGKPCANKVSVRGLDCPLDRNESLLVSENPLAWLVLNLLIKLQSLSQREVTNHNLCLLGTTLSKTAPRQLLSDFYLIFHLIYMFRLPKLAKWSTDKQVNLRSDWAGGNTSYKWAQIEGNVLFCILHKQVWRCELSQSWGCSFVLKHHNHFMTNSNLNIVSYFRRGRGSSIYTITHSKRQKPHMTW